MTIRIITGHVLDRLREMPDESVHCVVSSPPYFGLRDYKVEPQVWGGDPGCEHEWGASRITEAGRNDGGRDIGGRKGNYQGDGPHKSEVSNGAFCHCNAWRGSLGLEPTLDLYINHMLTVFREVRRVLRKDGTCWLNIGDSYASGLPGFKPKDLMLIPSRLAIRLQDNGWWVRSDIAWCKKAPMPESCTDRPTTAWEHVFLLTKSAKYFYDAEAVKVSLSAASLEQIKMAKRRAPSDETSVKALYSSGRVGSHADGRGDATGLLARKGSASRGAAMNESGRNLRNFWLLSPSPFPEAHFATFPPEIPRRAILAGTSERGVCPKCGASWERQLSKSIVPRCNIENETIGWQPTCSCAPDHAHCPLGCEHPQPFKDAGDLICGLCWHVHHQRTIMVPCGPDDCDPLLPIPATILDPFLGAGTTALVADQLGRNCIGIELNPQYVAMAERRIHDDAPLLTEIAAE